MTYVIRIQILSAETIAEKLLTMTAEQTERELVASGNIKRKSEDDKIDGELADLLSVAVNETINKIFKEAGAKVIFDYIKNNYHITLEEIVEKPEAFSAGLQRLTVSATSVIEKMILKSLYSKLNLDFVEKPDSNFADYVEELRRKMEVEG